MEGATASPASGDARLAPVSAQVGPICASGGALRTPLSAQLVSVPAGDGNGWRCYVRGGDCLVSIASADLVDVNEAVESVRRLAQMCREAGTAEV